METSRKKKITSAAAILMIIILLLTGTFAWRDFTQHATNIFEATSKVEVRLNDAFVSPPAWNPIDLPVDKKVSVSNQVASNTLAFVRLQFKEFLETYRLEYTPIMDGTEVVLFATYASGPKIGEYIKATDTEAVMVADFNYDEKEVTYPADYADTTLAGKTITYYQTKNEEIRNGIYGKSMNDPNIAPVSTVVKTFGDSEKADYSNPNRPHELQSASNTECQYEEHEWMNCGIVSATDGDAIHNYITWNLGAQTITMADWITQSGTAGAPILGDFWILDADGWAYWANALAPGMTTANIMESVELIKMPGQSFEYYIHIEMEAVTVDELLIEFYSSTTATLINAFVNSSASAYTPNVYSVAGAAAAGTGIAVGDGDGTASRNILTGNTYGPNNSFDTTDIIIGLDDMPGTADDNKIVNPAGTVLRSNVTVSRETGTDIPYVDLGNDFKLYPGVDGKIGTKDDLIQSFGSYAQASATAEALNWRLLAIDDTTNPAIPTAVIVTDVVLDNVPYNTAAGTTSWGASSLNVWLNGLYATVFTATEQSMLVATDVSMDAEEFRAYNGSSFEKITTIAQTGTTGDYVWALSGEEVWKYFGVSTVATTTNITKSGSPSDYTNGYAQGAANATATAKETAADWVGNSGWWLRSVGTDDTKASYVTTNGNIDASLGVETSTLGVRPAATIRLAP